MSQKVFSSFFIATSLRRSIHLFLAFCAVGSFQVSAQSYQINGVSEYTEFNTSVFAVKLELTKVRDNAQQIYNHSTTKKLSFRLLAERSPRLWSRMFIQNLSMNNNSDAIAAQTDDLITMAQAIKGNLLPGDLIEIERLGDNLTVMSINRVDLAVFETEGYFDFLLSGFVGDTPPTIEMKEELLANGEYSADMLALFDSRSYSQTRVSDINSWGPDLNVERPTVAQVPGPSNQVRGGSAMGGSAMGGSAMGGSAMGGGAMGAGGQAMGGGNQQARAGGGQGQGRGQQAGRNAMGSPQQPNLRAAMDRQFQHLTPESLLATQKYQKDAMQKVSASLVYPAEAQSRGIEADVRLAVEINERGEVMGTQTIDAQGNRPDFARFERAAINAVFDAAPFDTIPDSISERPFVVDLNVAFRAGKVASRNR